MKVGIPSIEELTAVARQLLDTFPEERFYAFFGPMGVGKTTLIKAICAELGVEQNVCSPTFAIINEYADRHGEPVYHLRYLKLFRAREA